MFLPPMQTPVGAQDPTVPAHVAVAATANGRGVQIYACAQVPGTQPEWQWVFQTPEATLSDPATHEQVATHSAGPTWVWRDGSTVTGKVLEKAPSPHADAIPSLLLAAAHPANTPAGVLSSVTLIRRSDAQAGNAPSTGCDAVHAGTVLRVPYTAIYTFYRPAS